MRRTSRRLSVVWLDFRPDLRLFEALGQSIAGRGRGGALLLFLICESSFLGDGIRERRSRSQGGCLRSAQPEQGSTQGGVGEKRSC